VAPIVIFELAVMPNVEPLAIVVVDKPDDAVNVPAEVIVPEPDVEILPDVEIAPVPEIVPVTVNMSPVGNVMPPFAVSSPATVNEFPTLVTELAPPIVIGFAIAPDPVPMLIPPPLPVISLAPVPIFKIPLVCPAANEILPVCIPPIAREPVVKFEPIVIADDTAVASYVDDVILVPTFTLVPFNATVLCPDVPITIGVTPTLLDPIFIAPVVRVAVVGCDPMFKVPVVCDGAREIVPVVEETALLIFVPCRSMEPQ